MDFLTSEEKAEWDLKIVPLRYMYVYGYARLMDQDVFYRLYTG